MDILGIGPLELVLVLLLALLIFGPEDLVSTGRKMGRFFNKLVKSDTWGAVRSISRELRTLPNRLAREAELEEISSELKNQTILPPIDVGDTAAPTPKKASNSPEDLKAWTSPPASSQPNDSAEESPNMADPSEDANENKTS